MIGGPFGCFPPLTGKERQVSVWRFVTRAKRSVLCFHWRQDLNDSTPIRQHGAIPTTASKTNLLLPPSISCLVQRTHPSNSALKTKPVPVHWAPLCSRRHYLCSPYSVPSLRPASSEYKKENGKKRNYKPHNDLPVSSDKLPSQNSHTLS